MSEEVPTTSEESVTSGQSDSATSESNTPLTPDIDLPKTPDLVEGSNNEMPSSQDPENNASEGEGSVAQSSNNEARLEQLEKEHETLKSQYMRIAADFDNFRKRQSRDQDDLRLQLTCTTLSSILPVVDNFERARQQLDPEGEEAKALHRSYQGLYKQLVDVLKQLGVAPMRVLGQAFDPNLHEAVLREPSEQESEDIILEELQRGYHLNGRVLRHALVKVSMGPGSTDENLQESDSESMDSSSVSDESAPDQQESC